MCCKKRCCVVPIILLIVVILLCAYIFLCTECKGKNNNTTNTSETNNQNNVVSDNYTYKDIAGYYSAKDIVNIGSETFNVGYHLYLNENGTFYYGYVMSAIQSTIGNYTIVGNEIHLNYLFYGGSDAGLTAATGSKVLTIEDNTITDNNAKSAAKCGSKTITDNDAQSTAKCGPITINLEKDTTINYNSNEYDVNYLINNYELFNKTNTNY